MNAVFPLAAILALAAGNGVAQVSNPPGSPAAAGVPSGDTTAVGEVVVTGSLIARKDYVAESPIATVTYDAIAKTGGVTVDVSLNQMPQFAPSAGAASDQAHMGQAIADLRGLGEQRTLVLLDGVRLQPSNPDGAVDLNTIPQALIDNIEVITGGASAVYGSDAIAGVVNFKLKQNFSGVELTAQYGVTGHGDGATEDFSGIIGGKFADDKGSAVVALDYSNRDAVYDSQRDFFRLSGISTNLPFGIIKPNAADLPTQAAVNAVFAGQGVAPGTVKRTNTIGFNNDGTLYSESSPAIGLQNNLNGVVFPLNNTYFYNTNSGNQDYLQLPFTRYSIYAHADYDLTSSIKLYTQGYYTDYTAVGTIVAPVLGGAGVPPVFVPYNNPFVPAALATILASRPNPTAPFIFSKRMVESGLRVDDYKWSVYQFLVGASGTIPVRDWTWNIYASKGQAQSNETDNGTPSLSATEQLLNAPDGGASLCAGGYNPFGLSTLSTACSNFISRTLHSSTTLDQSNIQAILQGGLFKLPAGDLRFALGADYRENTYNFSPDSELVRGDIVNGGIGTFPSQGEENAKEVYGELSVPILRDLVIKALDVDLAYRYSDYNVSGGASSYKASFDLQATDWLRFRGGYQVAIRAPNLSDLFLAPTLGGIGNTPAVLGQGDPCDIRAPTRSHAYANAAQVAALCQATGVPAALIGSYQNTNTGQVTQTEGNKALRPETAETFSVGAVIRSRSDNPFLAHAQLSVDYYSIDVTKAIGALGGQSILNKCFNEDGANPTYSPTNFYCGLISREPATGLISLILTPTLNLAEYRTSGVDIEGDWKLNLSDVGLGERWGGIAIDFVGSYLNTFEIQTFPGSPFFDYAGTIGNTTIDPNAESHPRLRTSTTFTYETGPVSASLTWRYIDAMGSASNVGTGGNAPGVPAINYLDLTGKWLIRRGLEVQAGVINLADTRPPQYGAVPGTTDNNLYDVIGRRFFVRFTSKF